MTQKETPCGLGGWLILPILGFIATSIGAIVRTITTTIIPFYSKDDWDYFTSSQSEGYHYLFPSFLIFKFTWNILLIIIPPTLLFFTFKKDRRLPKLAITYLAANIALTLIDFIFIIQIPSVSKENPEPTNPLRGAIIAAIIWIPYFIRSKRVKNTFVN